MIRFLQAKFITLRLQREPLLCKHSKYKSAVGQLILASLKTLKDILQPLFLKLLKSLSIDKLQSQSFYFGTPLRKT
jgi:hypothetical protein